MLIIRLELNHPWDLSLRRIISTHVQTLKGCTFTILDQVPRGDSINLCNILMIDSKCSYKCTQVRNITKDKELNTLSSKYNVLAKATDTFYVLRKLLLNILSDSIIINKSLKRWKITKYYSRYLEIPTYSGEQEDAPVNQN